MNSISEMLKWILIWSGKGWTAVSAEILESYLLWSTNEFLISNLPIDDLWTLDSGRQSPSLSSHRTCGWRLFRWSFPAFRSSLWCRECTFSSALSWHPSSSIRRRAWEDYSWEQVLLGWPRSVCRPRREPRNCLESAKWLRQLPGGHCRDPRGFRACSCRYASERMGRPCNLNLR